MTSKQDYDAKMFLTKPWHGQRGPPFMQCFKPDFIEALKLQKDSFGSVAQFVLGKDFGGWAPGAPAHIAGAGAAAIQNVLSIQARITRGDTFFSLLKKHILNQDIVDAINAQHLALVGAPPAAGPAGPGGPAVPGQLPTDWAMQLWTWLEVNHGQLRQTGLLHSNQNDQWAAIKITDVGINEETLRKLYGHLLRTNLERQNPYAAIELWTKFLKLITFPKMLADMAIMQLQQPTYLDAAGNPDLGSLVSAFEEIWMTIYAKGIEIKPQAAPRPQGPPSGRVDGMNVQIHDALDQPSKNPDDYPWNTNLTNAQLHEAYIVTAGSEASAFLKDERNCWKCRGWGHTKEDCPSPVRPRPIAACVQGLQELQESQHARLRTMQSRRPVRRSGPSPGYGSRGRGRGRGAPSPYVAQTPNAHSAGVQAPLVQYDDGGIFTEDGDIVVEPPMSETEPHPESSTLQLIETRIDTEPDQYQGSTTVTSAVASAKPINTTIGDSLSGNSTVSATAAAASTLDETIEQDFQSTFELASTMVCSPSDDSMDAGEFTRVEKDTTLTRVVKVVCAAGLVLGACATAVRSQRGKAMLLMLCTMATPALSSLSPDVMVHTSQFSKTNFATFESFDFQTRDTESNATCRSNAIMDSGTTECASGRKKLFPLDLVHKRHPNVKVEVASGVCLQVEWQGGMALKVRKYGATSAKKTHTLVVKNSYYVPMMPVTLVSTKALFRYHGIRTYFNDDLYLKLPDDTIIGFVETKNNYTLILDGDDTSTLNIIREPLFMKQLGTTPAFFNSTLRDPIPFTWTLAHGRFTHFSPTRLLASLPFLESSGLDQLGVQPRSKPPCIACVKGGFRGHRRGHRPHGQFTRFGQRVYSDSCAMPKSTPFGFTYMYIFYDAYSKHIAVYYGKTTTAEEMLQVFQQYLADYGRYMKHGKVEEWYTDGGPEFSSESTTEFMAEMQTRIKTIPPWNPWMNVAETGWRIILRVVRTLLASGNVTRRLWPFAVSQAVRVHNALSTASESATEGGVANFANFSQMFIASLNKRDSPSPSPWFLVTGKKYDASHLRTMFCEMEVRIRSKPDLAKREKVDPITYTACHLGISSKAIGYLCYIFSKQRFTTCSFNDAYFRETVFPPLDKIVGTFELGDRRGHLPTEAQQGADTSGIQFPELDDVSPPLAGPPASPTDHHRATNQDPSKKCPDTTCQVPSTNGRHDDGDPRHTAERIGDNRPGLISGRTRSRVQRDMANIATALSNDTSGILGYSGHKGFPIIIAGDDPSSQISICYNTEITEYGNVLLPSNTRQALNGPQGAEWLKAYAKDLHAKISNAAFKYVKRESWMRVLKTKVAHAVKRNPLTNTIDELRARWVGMGFLQGPGDFNETYSATPTACGTRTFLCMVLQLELKLAQGDVTKAFTLNPIDVELHVEQMPGMETAGDFPGATKENTVCKLSKCLEGLKQSGAVWQVNHTAALLDFKLTKDKHKFTQSTIEPTLFVLHCSSGIIAILVWVDDILVGFKGDKLYDEFVQLYAKRFPSKHHLGCTKFAGLSIKYTPGVSLQIDQRHHIEMAYEKFILDKDAAKKSASVTRIAISDRDSKHHPSKITLAANDQERSLMRTKPFLAALATMMYVGHWTLPHIVYLCSHLGQFMHDASPQGFQAVLDMIIYCYFNRDLDIIMYTSSQFTMPRQLPERSRAQFESDFGLHGYSDASWLLRSVAAYVVIMCNGPIDWKSALIKVICHSSAEAEIAAGCHLGKRAVFIKEVVSEFHVRLGKFMLLIDNTAALDLSKKLGVQSRTAHFQRWQHYLRWLVLHQYVELHFVGTKEQLADGLTKVLDLSAFLLLCRQLYTARRRRSIA